MQVLDNGRTFSHFGERQFVNVDGLKVAVHIMGRGEPCLLLHGYPQTHWCWRRVAAELSKTHLVIAPDWFGWGDSERSISDVPDYDTESRRIGLLADALALQKFNLVIHDYAGHIGLGFAAQNQDRVLRLGVLNSRAHSYFPIQYYMIFGALSFMAKTPGLHALLPHAPIKTIHSMDLRQYVRKGVWTPEDLDRYLDVFDSRLGRLWFSEYYKAFQVRQRPGLADACKTITRPSSVVWGDVDPYSPLRVAQELSSLLPDSTLEIIRGAGHFVAEERPDDVVHALRRLLARPT